MSKEFEGLEVPKIIRSSPKLDYWLPNWHHKELDRPITKMLLGVIPGTEERYYPIEIDLLKETTKTIYIVGEPSSKKELLMRGMVKYAAERTAPPYLRITTLTRHDDPWKINDWRFTKRHMGRNDSARAPEGVVGKVILEGITRELAKVKPFMRLNIDDKPHILLIDDLGYFMEKGRPESKDLLKGILRYKGWQPFLTIALIDPRHMEKLTEEGLGADVPNSGYWFVGKSVAPDPGMEDFPDGYFMQWNPKKKKMGQFPIIPFE